MTSSSTKFSCVADLKTGTFLANSRESVRVMGVVTTIGGVSPDDQAVFPPFVMGTTHPLVTESESENNNMNSFSDIQLSQAQCTTTSTIDDFLSVTLDDGTDLTAFLVCRRMINSPSAPSLEVGKTYDCILKLRQSCEEKRWFAETLIQIDNPIDEHFRWLELSHHDQSLSQSPLSRSRYSNLCHKFGFPTRRRTCVEVYRLICLHSQLQQEQQQRKKQTPIIAGKIHGKRNHPKLKIRQSRQPQHRQRGLQNISTNTNRSNVRNENLKRRSIHSPAPSQPILLEGLLLKDLATVLQKSERNVQEMVEDLQMEGKIYQNERGEYLPL